MPGSASAALLNWEGSTIVLMGDYPSSAMTGGGVATVNGSSGVIPAHLSTLRLAGSRGQVAGTFTTVVTDPELAANGIAAFIFQQEGGTISIGAVSGGAASTSILTPNAMVVSGMMRMCLLSTSCTVYLDMPFTEPTTVNGVPGTGRKGLGVGGLLTIGGYGGIRMSVQGAPWTIKTGTVIDHITTTGGQQVFTTVVLKGWAHAPVSTTTSTAQPGGMLQLVSPAQMMTNLPLGSNEKVAGGASFVLRFIPEPGLLLLLASSVTGMAVLGRRRMRK
jgi:hypothetical protein